MKDKMKGIQLNQVIYDEVQEFLLNAATPCIRATSEIMGATRPLTRSEVLRIVERVYAAGYNDGEKSSQ